MMSTPRLLGKPTTLGEAAKKASGHADACHACPAGHAPPGRIDARSGGRGMPVADCLQRQARPASRHAACPGQAERAEHRATVGRRMTRPEARSFINIVLLQFREDLVEPLAQHGAQPIHVPRDQSHDASLPKTSPANGETARATRARHANPGKAFIVHCPAPRCRVSTSRTTPLRRPWPATHSPRLRRMQPAPALRTRANPAAPVPGQIPHRALCGTFFRTVSNIIRKRSCQVIDMVL